MIRADINIEGAQLVTIGTKITLSVDFQEVDGQSFTISSATATLYDEDGDAVSGLTGLTGVVTTGLNSDPRLQVTFPAASTATLTESAEHYLIWTITFGDTQTRLAKQAIEVREVS